jgi:hypothetical protein
MLTILGELERIHILTEVGVARSPQRPDELFCYHAATGWG